MILSFLKSRIGGADIDMMPNPFSFATYGGQNPNVDVASAVTRITGISVPVPVSCSSGSFRILAADAATPLTGWVTFGTLKNNQCVQLLQRSSNAYSGQVSMTVYVGRGSASWTVQTLAVSGGSAGWGSPGTYWFTIPHHNVFNFDVYGAGAGGAGASGVSSNFDPYFRGGGWGNGGGYSQIYDEETGGGKVNVIGWTGGGGSPSSDGGNGGNGAGGGAQGGDGNVAGGGAGGGGGGLGNSPFRYWGGSGGPGGRAYRGVSRGLLTPGTRLVINVGQGGSPGANGAVIGFGYDQQSGGWGGNGACYISWG